MQILPKIFLVCSFIFSFSFYHPLNAQTAGAIGMQLYTYRDQLSKDVPGTLSKIAALPIKVVEGGGTYGMEPQAFKQLLQKNGLQLASYNASFEDLEKSPEVVAEKAKFFGAKHVVCTWVPHKGDVFSIEDAQKAVQVFNNAGKLLRQKGLAFAYHPHGYEFQPYQNGTFFDYMVKEMNPQYANFQMDVFWFYHSGQDPVMWLQKIPKRFISLHLKDRQHGTVNNQTGHADVETNVTLGAGDVPIAQIMQAAKKAGVQYYFIEDESSRVDTQVPLSLTYLKGLK